MKTLEEVIKKFELCNSYSYDMCNNSCPYFDDKCVCDPDALHYLKEYRDSKATIADAMERYTQAALWHMDESNKLAAQRFVMEYDNPPLTLDELNGMEGKPVWVEESAENGLWWTYWVIWQGDNAVLPKKDYSTKWQAYRKERE